MHVGRHRFLGSAVRYPKGAYPRVLGRLHRGHYPRGFTLLEGLLQRCVEISLGCLLSTSGSGCICSGIFLAATTSATATHQHSRQRGYDKPHKPPLVRTTSEEHPTTPSSRPWV